MIAASRIINEKKTSPRLRVLSASPPEATGHHSWAPCDEDQCPPEGLEVRLLTVLTSSPAWKLQDAVASTFCKNLPSGRKVKNFSTKCSVIFILHYPYSWYLSAVPPVSQRSY